MRKWSRFLLCICSCVVVRAADNYAIFQDRILPILAESCGGCHGGSKPQNDLAVTSYEGLLRGGQHGQAIVPGSSQASLLIQYITVC
jgi:hypothetical protein